MKKQLLGLLACIFLCQALSAADLCETLNRHKQRHHYPHKKHKKKKTKKQCIKCQPCKDHDSINFGPGPHRG